MRRKTPTVDMTAMCDVAFLLLSFFILTTHFKPNEAITVETPSSVASKVAPQKDVVMVSIDKQGKVYLSMDDKEKKGAIADELNSTKHLGINRNEFINAEYIGVPFSKLASFLAIPAADRKASLMPGIPVADSSNNEMVEWMRIINDAYQGEKMNLLLKGDNLSKYPSFKSVITAFKKNDFLKFQMVTNPEAVPVGSELWRNNMKGVKSDEE